MWRPLSHLEKAEHAQFALVGDVTPERRRNDDIERQRGDKIDGEPAGQVSVGNVSPVGVDLRAWVAKSTAVGYTALSAA